jgi:hypothetical protein
VPPPSLARANPRCVCDDPAEIVSPAKPNEASFHKQPTDGPTPELVCSLLLRRRRGEQKSSGPKPPGEENRPTDRSVRFNEARCAVVAGRRSRSIAHEQRVSTHARAEKLGPADARVLASVSLTLCRREPSVPLRLVFPIQHQHAWPRLRVAFVFPVWVAATRRVGAENVSAIREAEH